MKWGALVGADCFWRSWVLCAANAAELLEYCARLLDLFAARAAESLDIGYCARLLSCCDAGVLREAAESLGDELVCR